MAKSAEPYYTLQITPYSLFIAILTAILVITGIWFINSATGLNAIENFETLCNRATSSNNNNTSNSDSSQSQSQSQSQNTNINVAKPLSKEDVTNMNTLVSAYLNSKNPNQPNVSPITANKVDMEPCTMLKVPLQLTNEQSIVAISLEQELAKTVLPSTLDARQKMYDDVRKAILENENIPDVFKKRQISDADARAIILVMAVNKSNITNPNSSNNTSNNTKNNMSADLIIGKAEAEMPGRGLLIELAIKTIPLEVNTAIVTNGGNDVSPEVISLFDDALQKMNNMDSQNKIKYSAHRTIFCHKILNNL